MSKTRASEEEDFEVLVSSDACAVRAMPPTAAAPAVAPIPMTTLLRLTALCFTSGSLGVLCLCL
ncbi:hypothetical protein [Streptomyces sp. V4I8]|uniref:hypothetical protein n=1 Tax=Streptomyces sp. V4I8 TaxID=3156469 RepID=UPI0035169063